MSRLRVGRRIADRLRRVVAIYATAGFINIELVWRTPSARVRTIPPISSLQDRPLIDGAWDAREVLPGLPRRVVVVEADGLPGPRDADRWTMSAN